MKKSLLLLLAGIMAVSATVQATTYTDKTYMNVRQPLNDMPTEISTWKAAKAAHGENMFGGSVQVAGFYSQSLDRADAGKYFGTKNSSNGDAIENFISAGTAAETAQTQNAFISNMANANWAAKISLSPRRSVGGARLDYHQKLNMLLEGLWFKVNMPIVSVEHRLDMQDLVTPVKTAAVNAVVAGKTILDALSGNYATTAAAQGAQKALTSAKLIASRSAAGVADINLSLGYTFLHEEMYHLGANIGLTIPTGNKSSGEFLFEPVYGSRHFALGAGLGGCYTFYNEGDLSLHVGAGVDYRYQFKAEEIRTAGFTNVAGTQAESFSHWVNIAKVGDNAVSPAANILTQAMNVTPGSQVEATLGFGGEWGSIVMDLGYNLFFRDAENVSLKTAWTDGQYGIANGASDVSGGFALANAMNTGYINNAVAAAIGGRPVVAVTLAPCTTPQILSHKIYSNVGYVFKEMETPVHVGLGGWYEFKGDNAALSTWGIAGKIGVAF